LFAAVAALFHEGADVFDVAEGIDAFGFGGTGVAVGEGGVLGDDARVCLGVGFETGTMDTEHVKIAAAALTITPLTWNIIGLDSNNVNVGPNDFPVGARVCNTGDATATNVVSTFVWDTSDPYINLRPGSLDTLSVTSLAAGICTDFYYEVELTRNSSAYNHARRYRITATADTLGTISTPTPREVFVEHLISQNRNGITDVKLNGASVAAGGSMTLVVGNTYTIEMDGFTATQGYNQLESFIHFPNTIFLVQAVSTTYSADSNTTNVPNPNSSQYANACVWDNDPASANYRSCIGTDDKAGGTVIVTYTVKVISGGGTSQVLTTLLYDFSGSSFHYNSDYSTNFRIANIVDPTNVTIAKSFTPSATVLGGISALTITLTNPNPGSLAGYNFTDPLPTNMKVAATPGASTSGCGSPTFAPAANDTTLTFTNGTLAANSSCTISVNVTTTAQGSFVNTTNHLFVGLLDTGKFASATLTVDNNFFPPPVPPSTCTQKVTIATWTMPSSGQGSGGPPPPYTTKVSNVATATASAGLTGAGAQTIVAGNTGQTNAWQIIDAWPLLPVNASSAAAPYFDFVLDTSKYGGIDIAFDYDLEAPGDWASNNDNHFNIYTSANNGAFSAATAIAATKSSWLSIPATVGTNIGTSTTQFRIGVDGRNGSKATATVKLDNIVFRGCPVPPNPPTITKSFSPNPIAVGANSTLTFTINNPNTTNANTLNGLTGIAFSDTLPAGLVLASNVTASQCGGTVTGTAGGSVIGFSGGTLAANTSCNITVTVTANTAGPHNNVSGYISSSQTGTNSTSTGYATANLVAVSPPTIAKDFNPDPILTGGVSTLTFTITNPNQNNAISGVAFADTFPITPGQMRVAGTPNASTSCGGTVTAVANAVSMSFAGGSIAAAGTCTVKVDVTAPTAGTYNNTSGTVSHILNNITYTGNTASDSLVVKAPVPGISILKQVSTTASGPWRTSLTVTTGENLYYRFVIENTGDVDLNPVTVTDPTLAGSGVDPANCTWSNPLKVASPTQDPTQTCIVGPVTAVVGTHPNTATAHGTYNAVVYNSSPSRATYTATSPTSADLVSFKASRGAKGISVKWETGSELTVMGFNVWRKNGKGSWKQLNAQVIEAKNLGSPSGASYTYSDKSVKEGKTYRYKLEILKSSGKADWSDVIKIK